MIRLLLAALALLAVLAAATRGQPAERPDPRAVAEVEASGAYPTARLKVRVLRPGRLGSRLSVWPAQDVTMRWRTVCVRGVDSIRVRELTSPGGIVGSNPPAAWEPRTPARAMCNVSVEVELNQPGRIRLALLCRDRPGGCVRAVRGP